MSSQMTAQSSSQYYFTISDRIELGALWGRRERYRDDIGKMVEKLQCIEVPAARVPILNTKDIACDCEIA